MTRKDYIAALASVRASYAPHWNPNLFRALDDAAKALADHCQRDNERFNRDKFLQACHHGEREQVSA